MMDGLVLLISIDDYAVIPTKGENFKSTFLYKDAFKANYILNNPVKINANSSANSNEIRLFVAAKEVETIDAYAENQNISKFDLVIDWGWFYFFTKPLFFIIDYLFKYSGEFWNCDSNNHNRY